MRDLIEEPAPAPERREPIFIGWTRSFWAGILPLIVIGFDVLVSIAADPVGGPPVAATLAAVLAWALPDTWGMDPVPAQVEAGMRALAPLFGLIVAQQRAGASRPYTIDPRALK